jgi:CRISPR system Cascade subunit CasA
MMFPNLVSDKWLPIIRANGLHERVTPFELTAEHQVNPIIALAAPRPDFNGALMQFLIGLLQTTCAPSDSRAWFAWLRNPPTPDELREKFASVTAAFELMGDGPRFMQDLTLESEEEKPIGNLFIDSPGEKTQKDNLDHFIKRGLVEGVCSSCAATVLFTMQTNAPAGGVGHRTSLRGGGPLTTLVVFDSSFKPFTGQETRADTLWCNIWLNVLGNESFLSLANSDKNALSDIFPWMAPTKTSENGKQVTPEDAHPSQLFWAMPRRIRLSNPMVVSGHCDLCGVTSNSLFTSYVTKNYGVSYGGAWLHPLSPYTQGKDAESSLLPQHPQPGGITYRHWLGLALGEQTDKVKARAAAVVEAFQNFERFRFLQGQLRLWSFGYDMDNMKARCWYESTMPFFEVDASIRDEMSILCRDLVEASREVIYVVQSAIKQAWFRRPEDAKGDVSYIGAAFWQDTEDDFHDLINKVSETKLRTEAMQAWYDILVKKALAAFNYWVESAPIANSDPRRTAEARKRLLNGLYAKKLKQKLGIQESASKKVPKKKEVANG